MYPSYRQIILSFPAREIIGKLSFENISVTDAKETKKKIFAPRRFEFSELVFSNDMKQRLTNERVGAIGDTTT